jgi:transposase
VGPGDDGPRLEDDVRFIGIDVGSQNHLVAIVNEVVQVLLKPTSFAEDAGGYDKLRKLVGEPTACLVAMEATGHYGKNLLLTLVGWGFPVAVLNPLRARRFAEEDLTRAKTDSVDALGLARFAALKKPSPTALLGEATEQLRELVRLRLRLVQDFGDRQRQLHRLVDLCFPEFTRHVRNLDSALARAVLREFPTAEAFREATVRSLARLRYGGRYAVGVTLARELIEAAKVSVGRHQGVVYDHQVRYICDDLGTLATKIHELDSDIEARVGQHELGALLTTIDGIGPLSVAHIVAAVGDPATFRSSSAFAAYVGVVPGTRQSGLWQPGRSRLCSIGNARLRKALWMPTLSAVRSNTWLAAYYQRLRAKGKPPKVALVAAMRKLVTAIYSVAKSRKPFVARVEPSKS